MKQIILLLSVLSFSFTLKSQVQKVSVENGRDGYRLLVAGEVMMVKGVNWDYFPIGTNYSYSLWNESDAFIKQALDSEMSLVKNMGANAIRVYAGMPPKWIKYVYEQYGIYTMINHSFGRYGLTIDGTWKANTEYADPQVRELLLKEITDFVTLYKDTPGLLLFLLGNENNYGLFWDGAETEDIPVEEQKATVRAQHLYTLMNEATLVIKSIDPAHPVAICNGDLLFLSIIADKCKDIDILGVNMYRGISFTDAFSKARKDINKPLLFTEFGSDAFNTSTNEEDQISQANFLLGNWREIYENAAGLGKEGNSLGGFTFQFSDGWWKYGQTSNLDIHDSHASWSNGGYYNDYVEGENNMNEEWFGICAKGAKDENGHYQLYPRSAYYALQEAYQINPYTKDYNSMTIQKQFNGMEQVDFLLKARGDKAAMDSENNNKIGLSRFTAEFSTFNTGGHLISTPKDADPDKPVYPSFMGFDHMQSIFIGVEANPSPNITANVEFNILGNVAQNPIDQIFYENRGNPVKFNTSNNGHIVVSSLNRIQIYKASYQWDHKWFNLNGFYRTGHYHWGYEGDFFGLYPEANYGPQIDIYNGIAPFGLELAGKKQLQGLKLAIGPQLWWGANPALLLKHSKAWRKFTFTGIFHEDIDQLQLTESSFAVPQPKTRRLSLHLNHKVGKFTTDIGGIWAGQPLIGREFQLVRGGEDAYVVYKDLIEAKDNFGGKIKFTYTGGKFNWYGQSALMGLVAQGGADNTKTFTGWRLKDSGSGNQYNVLSGFTYTIGKIQIAPNFLWQKPIEGPLAIGVPAPGRPRNILTDPFVVRTNREQTSGEILITYDPTPGTWMYEWDNDIAEDAKMAISAGLVYRHLPTTQDAAIGIFGDGRTTFAFNGAPPAQDLWEINARLVSKMNPSMGWIANLYAGDAQANGSDSRTIHRYGIDMRLIYKKIKLHSFVKVNDWGPYDYHRDFNLTFPLQLMADLSLSLGKPDWFDLPSTNIGLRTTYRTLNVYSPRYAPAFTIDPNGNQVPDPGAIGFDNGNEWEIRTYVRININK